MAFDPELEGSGLTGNGITTGGGIKRDTIVGCENDKIRLLTHFIGFLNGYDNQKYTRIDSTDAGGMRLYGTQFEFDVGGTIYGKKFVEYSSERIKKNIETIGDEASNLLKLRPVIFQYKETGEMASGFIAEEVAEIFPELVHTEQDITGISYTGFIPYLVRMIQIQEAKIAKLEADINELKQMLKQ